MADLDNFFAKKDKKKKGGKKFTGTSTAEMVKALEVSVQLMPCCLVSESLNILVC